MELGGGNEAGKVDGAALHSALPPVGVLLVDDVDDVSGLELEAGLFARDEVVLGRVVIELSPHVRLHIKINYTHKTFVWLNNLLYGTCQLGRDELYSNDTNE